MSVYYFLYFPICKVLVAQSCPILCNPMNCCPPGSSVHGDSPGKNTGVGSSSRGSSTQRLNLGLPHCRQILHDLRHQESPLQWWFILNIIYKTDLGDFPGGPVIKTPCFHCRGPGFHPWLGKQNPTCHMAQQRKKRKGRKKKRLGFQSWLSTTSGAVIEHFLTHFFHKNPDDLIRVSWRSQETCNLPLVVP